MRLCVLGSGSSGNCVFVQAGETRILIDAGLSGRETSRRLEEINVDIADIQAICLTHEHSDHVSGLGALYSRHQIRIYANSGTKDALCRRNPYDNFDWNIFTTGSSGFKIGELKIEPFSVPHDASEPVGFVLTGQKARVGVVTDLGISTNLVRERLRDCQVIVLEANHDEQLLANSQRPEFLKQRIRGRHGHLSNHSAAEMLKEIACENLQQVFLAHISSECNKAELAHQTVAQALTDCGLHHVKIQITFPDRISEIWHAGTLCKSTILTPSKALAT